MKVLFAVSNDNVSASIVKKYQEKYKEIIKVKNVYYFNAIIKELQKDKTYDAVVIGEDLEPISNNNFDSIDKFLFEKLDNISDEAYKITGEDIPIILICSDRRTKSDQLLIKLFGIGIYNALIGNDRNIDMVCNLISKPRSKKEAKNYYMIDSEDVNYKPENEAEVSENEIKNILNHYKKIGNNEKKCAQSFESIASQYNETQLRIIIKFLPNSVKSILEKTSPSYQKLVNGGTVLSNGRTYSPYTPKNNRTVEMDIVTKDIEKPHLTQPVIIPSTMNIQTTKPVVQPNVNRAMNIVQNQPKVNQNNVMNTQKEQQMQNKNSSSIQQQATLFNQPSTNAIQQQNSGTQSLQIPQPMQFSENTSGNINQSATISETPTVRRRGRPKKITTEAESNQVSEIAQQPKRGRGRPRKNPIADDLENNNISSNQPEISNIETQGSSNQQPDESFNLFDLAQNSAGSTNVTEDLEKSNNELNLFELGSNTNQQKEAYAGNSNANNQVNQVNPYDLENNVNTQVNPYDLGNNVNTQVNPYDLGNNANTQVNPYDLGNNANTQVNPYDLENNINVQDNPYNQEYNASTQNNILENSYRDINQTQELTRTKQKQEVVPSNFIAQNKVVAFVGTSKNGTSFIVNNIAELLAQKGIKTAILDLTKNKNSYYMFTDNDQNLTENARHSINNLINGNPTGVQVNKNLTVFTSVPDEPDDNENFEPILQTLDNNFSAILLDCDFETNINYFVKATEIYLIQSMDALTIQPLTQFLSDLKLKNALEESKLRVVINKEMKLKILTNKMILDGMAKYNEPSMTLQRDLFDPNTIKYTTIPFEMQTYARYLEAIALCQISLSGYSQQFLSSLERLANMVYPLLPGGNNYNKYSPNYEKAEKRGLFKGKNRKQPPTQFSSGVNGTLDKMRANY